MASIDSQLIKLYTSVKEFTLQLEWSIENYQQILKYYQSSHYSPLSTSFSTNKDQQHWIIELGVEFKNFLIDNITLTLTLKKNSNGPLKIGWLVFEKDFLFKLSSTSRIVNTSDKLTLTMNKNTNIHQNKNITIICQLKFYKDLTQKFGIHKSLSHNQIITDLKNYFESKTNSDVTFIVGDVELKAHKFILMSRCSVFSRMLETDMIEKQKNEVKIDDARPEIFEKMLEFLYTNEIGTNLNDQDVEDLLAVAEKYQLEDLKKICEEIFFNCMTEKNALKIRSLAEQYSMQELLAAVSTFIKINGIIETPNPVT